MMEKQYYIYIMTNFENGTLYTGVTDNLIRRIYEHKNKLVDGFTKKYDLNKLVYYEIFDTAEIAILREKQIKGGSRKKKLELINNFNKSWEDLYENII
ncbi:MAG: GIY-YIG nuclease family protein [Candidatus Gastranaerophilaceae bacterium]